MTLILILLAGIAALCITYFAAHKIRPETFKLSAGFLRVFTFTLEMSLPRRDDSTDEPPD